MLTQGLALDQFCSDIVIAINFSDLINSQNVWVIESGSCLGFLDKAIQFVRVFAELIVQELDRDFAIEFRVLGEIDLSLIHISEPTRLLSISYAVFCLKKKK